MERIILEVDSALAKAWRNSTPSLRAIENTNEHYEWWNDEEMMAELDQSEADFRSGKDPGITWDALKAELLSRRNKNAS